jgi:hypothetical protein
VIFKAIADGINVMEFPDEAIVAKKVIERERKKRRSSAKIGSESLEAFCKRTGVDINSFKNKK